MKTINMENYEAFFIAYYENELSLNQLELLIGFLKAHPELENEFIATKDIIPIRIAPSQQLFPFKEMLKRSANGFPLILLRLPHYIQN